MAEDLKQLINYPDSKCTWGFMSLCKKCVVKAPLHVDINKPLDPTTHYFPADHCEICQKPGEVEK